jgi:hypothetical protein
VRRKIAAQSPEKTDIISKQNQFLMRNLLIFMFLVGVFVIGKSSCNNFSWVFGGVSGTGPVKTETRNVSNFNAINLEMPADVEVTIGEQFFVEVTTQENLLPILKTYVEDGVLQIHADQNIRSSKEMTIRITAPTFEKFSVSGSGSIQIANAIQAEKMSLNIAGSGDIISQQSAFSELQTSIAGSGTIELGGKANDMKADISGSGDIKAKSLTTNNLKVSISGSGTVTADVVAELDASISGSGDVFYTGSPSVQTSVGGSGSVKKLEVQ